MGVLLSVFLPLSLAFIMFSLGLGLTLADFARVVKLPKAFFAGAISQLVFLPIIAFVLLMIFPMPPEIAVGVMILSFCPGGVTSNIMTKLADGALALSITLTGVISLLAVLTVPLLVRWSTDYFMGEAAPAINVTSLALSMFAITAVPVAIGVALRHMMPERIEAIEPTVMRVATILFIIIVIGALAANWSLFIENLAVLGPVLIMLNVILLAVGYGFSRLLQLDGPQSIAVSIETGVQNSALGITVGGLIAEAATGLPPFSLPAGVYGITMYAVTLPFVWWLHQKHRAG